MKIAVFGASFNPLHKGHEAIVDYLIHALTFDRVILVPTGSHSFGKRLISKYHRLEFCKILARSNPKKIWVSSFEIKKRQRSYTFETMRYIQKKLPRAELSLIIGADNLEKLHNWYRFQDLSAQYEIVCFNRPEYTISIDNHLFKRLIYVDNFHYDLSSTFIRSDIENLIGFCSKKVQNYIKKKRLYLTHG